MTSDALPAEQQEAMLRKGQMIREKLEEIYPEAPVGFLNHTDPFTLLVAVLLSAQSLDTKVNEITPLLFQEADTPQKMRDLGEARIKELIKPIGLSPQKARSLARLSAVLCDDYDGCVPDDLEKLEKLPGVGHKTASVVLVQAFGKPAFPVDTHIHRLACRWGCGDPKSVRRTEDALKLWFPDPQTWAHLHTRIILFGREHCPARKHDMDACPVCSFAATVEARAANVANPNKFVGALLHKDPYSIQEVLSSAPGDVLAIAPGPSAKSRSPSKRKKKELAGKASKSSIKVKTKVTKRTVSKAKKTTRVETHEAEEATTEEQGLDFQCKAAEPQAIDTRRRSTRVKKKIVK